MLGGCTGRSDFVTITAQPATRKVGPFLVYQIRQPKCRRLTRLCIGLVIFGFALGLSVEAGLGVNPWTVFHGGLAIHTPLSIGAAVLAVGAVLVLSFPIMGEPIGVGTVLNVAMIGMVMDLTLVIVPDLTSLPVRIGALAIAPVLIGVGSGFYIGAGLGPGPRDGIMTFLQGRGLAVWLARSSIEFTALIFGALLGGDVGWGTIWMAGSVGFWVQLFLARLRVDPALAKSA